MERCCGLNTMRNIFRQGCGMKGQWLFSTDTYADENCTVSSETIFAPCTISSLSTIERSPDLSMYRPSAVCVIRISGPDALNVLRDVTKDSLEFRPNLMYVRSLYRRRYDRSSWRSVWGDDAEDTMVDHNALVVYFKGPRSFTGEDVVELHVHGGRAVVQDVMDRLMECGNHVRPAEPGEFTKRAFLNGKMDLTQIEGLSDVLSSQTRAQKDMALAQAMGMGRILLDGWKERLISCIASVEAVIDFGEDDIEPKDVERVLQDARGNANKLRRDIQEQIDAAPKSEIVKEGIRIVLIGPPNVGKSSLLNTMIGRSAAIVSPRPGTTRDTLEAAVDIGGHKVILQDGAGIRESKAIEEVEGMSRILSAAENAHIIVVVSAVDQPSAVLDHRVREVIQKAPRVIYVRNKDDLVDVQETNEVARHPDVGEPWVSISCHTGKGVDALVKTLGAYLNDVTHPAQMEGTSMPILHRSRHIRHMKNAVEALRRFHSIDALELAAEELRMAVAELGYVTGTVDVEDILESIFHEFCIGK